MEEALKKTLASLAKDLDGVLKSAPSHFRNGAGYAFGRAFTTVARETGMQKYAREILRRMQEKYSGTSEGVLLEKIDRELS